MHLLNLSANIDSNRLKFSHVQTNEIESLYELVVVKLFGDSFALPDSSEQSEDKINLVSYINTFKIVNIKSLVFLDEKTKDFTFYKKFFSDIDFDILSPPPREFLS